MKTEEQFVALMTEKIIRYVDEANDTEDDPFNDPDLATRVKDFIIFLERTSPLK